MSYSHSGPAHRGGHSGLPDRGIRPGPDSRGRARRRRQDAVQLHEPHCGNPPRPGFRAGRLGEGGLIQAQEGPHGDGDHAGGRRRRVLCGRRWLQLHPEAEGHPVHEVEIGGHRHEVVNGRIREPAVPQRLNVVRFNRLRRPRELHREREHALRFDRGEAPTPPCRNATTPSGSPPTLRRDSP